MKPYYLRLFSLSFLLMGYVSEVIAQTYDTASIFSTPIELDSFVVKSGFDMRSFVHRVKTDTSFYKAFKTMRLVPLTTVTSFAAYDKKWKEEASLKLETKQVITPHHCRKSIIFKKEVWGDFYDKRGHPEYYTAEMFLNLFFSEKDICNENDIVGSSIAVRGQGEMEKNKQQLKQLIFNPGSKIKGVPFMGDKASIFDDDEIYKYELKILQDTFAGRVCYKFMVHPKTEYTERVVFSELVTWFDQSDYSIVARNYALAFSTMFYNFDVTMQVRTTLVNGRLVPSHIYYSGKWHVFTQQAERMKVIMDISY